MIMIVGMRLLLSLLMLVITLVIAWGVVKVYVLFAYHFLPRVKRRLQDIFKIDPDETKKESLKIEELMKRKGSLVPTKTVQACLEEATRTDQVFLGMHQQKGKDVPFCIPESSLSRHMHVMGSTGSGKTKFCLLPLGTQMIRRGKGVIFLTFKEDRELGHVLRKEAEAAGKRFYYFSLNPNDVSHTYNPVYSGSPGSFVERLMVALDLEMEGSAKFYTHAQRAALTPVFSFFAGNRIIATLRDLYDVFISENYLSAIIKEETGRKVDAREREYLRGAGYALSRIVHEDIAERFMSYVPDIRLSEIMARGDILFCNLKTDANPALAKSLGKMILLDMQSCCGERSEDSPICMVMIDEFQDLACRAFLDLLTKLRASNLGFCLANQNPSQLEEVSREFAQTVHTNTATKVVFRLKNAKDAKLFAEDSGETEFLQRDMSQKVGGENGNVLDGVLEASGRVTHKAVNFLHPNRFLSLPEGEGVVFPPSGLPEILRYGYMVDRAEEDYTKMLMNRDKLCFPHREQDPETIRGVEFFERILEKEALE